MASEKPGSGILRLPDELIVNILRIALSDEIPSRDIATICKRWKSLLQANGTFWRKLRAEFVLEHQLPFRSNRLQRRVELSQSALIDVTLDVSGFRESSSKSLFEVLNTTDVGRWRSLRLESTGRVLPVDCIAGVFSGSFSSLRSLHLENTIGEDPYMPIYELLAQSSPVIRELHTDKPVPDLLLNSAVIRGVTDLKIPAQLFRQLYRKAPIENVYLTNSHGVNPAIIPPLPKTVKISVASNEMLSALDLSAVQDLDISYYSDRENVKIQLPSLISLILPKCIRYISLFVAPSLKFLGLGDDHLWGKEKIAESQRITKLFEEQQDQISMAPTSLEMHLSITTASTVAILSHWSQIQHLVLDFRVREHFAWQGAFAKGLKSSLSPLCPHLITLVLRTGWDEKESEKWQQTVRAMFKARKSSSLETVSWMHRVNQKETYSIITRQKF